MKKADKTRKPSRATVAAKTPPAAKSKAAAKPAQGRSRSSKKIVAPKSSAALKVGGKPSPQILTAVRSVAKSASPKPTPAPLTTPDAAPKGKRPPMPSFPAALLEREKPSAPKRSGPGQRYSLGPSAPAQPPASQEGLGELPESYGSKRLFLTARDPHWLHLHWDLTREQMSECLSHSRDQQLFVRLFRDQPEGELVKESRVRPEASSWFVRVEGAATPYAAALGYYDRKQGWVAVSRSEVATTPPDRLAEPTPPTYARVATEQPSPRHTGAADIASGHESLAQALEQLRRQGDDPLACPAGTSVPISADWMPNLNPSPTPKLEAAHLPAGAFATLELAQWLPQGLFSLPSSGAFANGKAQDLGLPTSLSSLEGIPAPPAGRRSFRFSANAELIIYGATEPDAQVILGDREVKLRPDGSFSCRFTLPDGEYELPLTAISRDQGDSRQVVLKFRRSSDYRGDVGAHPQDPGLKPPTPESLS